MSIVRPSLAAIALASLFGAGPQGVAFQPVVGSFPNGGLGGVAGPNGLMASRSTQTRTAAGPSADCHRCRPAPTLRGR